MAGSFNIQWEPFPNVIHSLCVLRNLCAHHSQLWQRTLDIQCPIQKKLKPKGVHFNPQSIFAAIVMLNSYREKIDGNINTANEMTMLIESDTDFCDGIYNPQPR